MPNETTRSPDDNFESLNSMQCNTVVHLQILTPTKAIRLKTRLIGVDPNMSVILAIPRDNSWCAAKNFIREGQGAIVRLINTDSPEASIIAFRTNIQKVMSIAGNWLVMDYPQKELQKASLRKFSRIPINIKCSIIERSSQAKISHGVLSDISINGCAYIGEPLPQCTIDSKYDLHIKQVNEESALSSPVTIKNILEKEHYSNQQQFGLAFEDDSQATQDFIQKVILRHLTLSATINTGTSPE